MSQDEPPWHSCRTRLAQKLQTLQSKNKAEVHAQTQGSGNAVQQLHLRIAAVKNALVIGAGSHNTARTAATPPSMSLDDPADDDISAQQSEAAQSIFNDALAAHDALDFATALPLFKLAGEAGHGGGCGYVALYLIEGRGAARDSEQAWVWACRGAEQRDAASVGLKAR
jgi:TPR repeat protein